MKNLREYNKGRIALTVLVSMIIFAVGIKLGTETILTEFQSGGTYRKIEEARVGANNIANGEVTSATTDKNLLKRLLNVKIKTEEGKEVQLSNGGADMLLPDDNAKETIKGFAGLGDIALEHISPNGRYVLTYGFINTGGSGTFVQLWLFKEGKNDALTFLTSQFIDDRVPVLGLRLDENDGNSDTQVMQAKARIKERAEGEPMAADPTIEKIFSATVNHEVFRPESAQIQ